MKFFVFWSLIVAVGISANGQNRAEVNQIVFQCDFEVEQDENYDNWPDHWLRRRGPGYPHYLEIEIKDDRTSRSGNRALQLKLDGGAAMVYSPPIPISSSYSYLLRARVRTSGLQHDAASIELQFLDSDKKPIGKPETSTKIRKASRWTDVTVGPTTSIKRGARFAQLIARVSPGEKADLTGSVWFDDIRLARVPRMDLVTNRAHNLFTDAADIELSCRVSGIETDSAWVDFELFDQWGKSIAQGKEELIKNADTSDRDFSGVATWRPLVATNGFYRGEVRVRSGDEVLVRSVNIVLTSLMIPPERGEFGWALDDPGETHQYRKWATLFSQAGLNWLKFPVWFNPNENERADEVAAFAERLDLRDIAMVGVLDQPPPSVKQSFGRQEHFPAASLFADPSVWGPVVDPVISRLALKVRWWQLGADDDTSFVGYPELAKRVEMIKNRMERFGQKIQIGFAWKWQHPEEESSLSAPWDFLALSEVPPFTPRELGDHLANRGANSTSAWVNLQPLRKGDYQTDVRAKDLALRMVAAKKGRGKRDFRLQAI